MVIDLMQNFGFIKGVRSSFLTVLQLILFLQIANVDLDSCIGSCFFFPG